MGQEISKKTEVWYGNKIIYSCNKSYNKNEWIKFKKMLSNMTQIDMEHLRLTCRTPHNHFINEPDDLIRIHINMKATHLFIDKK